MVKWDVFSMIPRVEDQENREREKRTKNENFFYSINKIIQDVRGIVFN